MPEIAIGDYTVHIVDDEEAVRKSLAFLLTMNGFAVRVHNSATDFLAAPGIQQRLSGHGFAYARHERRRAVAQPAGSGRHDACHRHHRPRRRPMAVEAMRAGALDFIEKPFEDRF